MEVIIPLVISFLIPLISAPLVARRRIELSGWTICWRYGLVASGVIAVLMILMTAQLAAAVGGGLGALFFAIFVLPTALLAGGLGMGGAAIGITMVRRK